MSEKNPVRISVVQSAADLTRFIEFPFTLYAGAEHYVPPIIKDEKKLLTPDAHPFWENARRELFLAYAGERVVGRIAAIVDETYNAYAGEKCGAWGFFECEENAQAARALFDAAATWLKAEGMEFMRGPLNPSTNYTCGVLVSGFELEPCIMMPWNYPYYPRIIEECGFHKEQDLFAYTLHRDTLAVPAWLSEQIAVIKERKEFTWRRAAKATMREDIHCMLDIFKESWAQNWGFTPMSLPEAKNHVESLKSILDPEFFVLFYHKGEPAGGMLALPDMNPLLKRLNGKIGITAPWHLWRARKEIRGTYRMVLFGVREKFRLMGLPLLLFNYMLERAEKMEHFKSVEGSWLLEDNVPVNTMLEDFGGNLNKRYRIYRKELIEPCL